MNISSISRLTASTELIRRFIERRGVSISTQLAPATMVAERRRPEIKLISPKNSPRLRLMRWFFSASMTICTSPSTIEKKVFV